MKKETSRSLHSYRAMSAWLWRTWQGYRLQAILNTALGITNVMLDLLFVWIIKETIDIATHRSEDFTLTQTMTALCVVIGIQIAIGISSRWIRAVLGVRAQNKMQAGLFKRLLNSEWRGLRGFHTGNLLNRLEKDVDTVIGFLTESLPSLLITITNLIGSFFFLYYLDKKLALAVLSIAPIFVLISKLYMKRLRQITHEIRDTDSAIQSTLQEGLQHSLVLKTLERVNLIGERLSVTQQTMRQQVVQRTRYSSISQAVMTAGFSLGYIVTFAWGLDNMRDGVITYGYFVAYIQLVSKIQSPVRALTGFVPIFLAAFTATERLMELEKIPLERKGKLQHLDGNVGIQIENVSFQYERTSRKIYDGFSYTFEPNSVTAIVGETGSGKTTLIRMLLSLLRPTQGTIALFNEKGEKCEISPLSRGNFSYVPQGNTLLSGTIRENLLLGDPRATDEQMWEALHLASATFVERLPEGLDARCGEQGDGLSEGQAQRLSIARALLKRSPILLLDEATSSLDMETEARVIRNIIEHQKGRTLIFITHRPEVLKYCTHTLRLS